MDLYKLLDVTAVNPISQSDSFLSKNTSLLKSFSCFEPSSSTTITSNNSFNVNSNNNDEDNLKQLIQQVTKQDLVLNIINKCIHEENTTENKPVQDVVPHVGGKNIPSKIGKLNRFTENKNFSNKNNEKFKKFTNSTPSISNTNRIQNSTSTPYNTNDTANSNGANSLSSLLDSELKNKIQKIIKYNSLKATYEENNLEHVLMVDNERFDIGHNGNDVKLNKQESDVLNEVVEKCVDQMYMQTIMEKRHLSTRSSLDRIQELQTKINAKYHAVESLLTSIGNTQDEMLRLSTEEYHRSVVQESYKMAEMSLASVNKLHAHVVISLGIDGTGANMSSETVPQSHQQPSPPTPDLNESFLALDTSISNLSYSITSLKLELSELEQRLARHKQLESNPGSAAIVKTIRKLNNAIKQKKFILKQLMGE